MRDKVLAAIELYASGGTITKAIAASGLKSVTPFYATLRKDPEVMAIYEAAIKVRAYVMNDEAYEIGSDSSLDAKVMRAMADIRMKLAAVNNPDRFGDRVNVQVEQKPSLIMAIEAGKSRTLRPPCDPALITDAEYTVIPSAYEQQTSDKQSAAPEIASAVEPIDPFAP